MTVDMVARGLIALGLVIGWYTQSLLECAPIKPAATPRAGEKRDFEIAPKVVVRFCWIPAGEAQLGIRQWEHDEMLLQFGKSKEVQDALTLLGEEKRGKFQSKGYWLAKYEVTQKQYEGVIGKNPSGNQEKGEDTANYPVENVCWDDCQAFIKKCVPKGGKLRLPTENEWEYAYRGGKGNDNCYYWGKSLNGEQANCDGRKPFGTDEKGEFRRMTAPVGSYEKKAPHPWGLCDMSGNVSEWCEDVDPSESVRRILRGGNWDLPARSCRGGCRHVVNHYERWAYDGFRLLLVPE